MPVRLPSSLRVLVIAAASLSFTLPALPLAAESLQFRQSILETASGDRAIAAFYEARSFEPIWTGSGRADRQRRAALLEALQNSGDHGLPTATYDTSLLTGNLSRIRSDRDLGRLEVAISRLFLEYARDVQSGVLIPSQADPDIKRRPQLRDQAQILDAFSKSTPSAFMDVLPPQTPEYSRLMKHKLLLDQVIANGGWGATVPGGKYQLGDSGNGVIALRNRLIAMGYLPRNARTTYDAALEKAVIAFQTDFGLLADGVAGSGTISEINLSPQRRLGSVIAAMERERWLNMPRGNRHIWVNIPDFTAKIIDNGKVTFETRAVVGENKNDQRTPEFSDQMEHMVVNPSWYVPRSITVKEYLPMMQQDPNAVSHLQLLDPNGNVVSRQGWDFNLFDENTFPFDLKQPPSTRNALGLVKFMFPNRYNIYLHDTPAKNLFGHHSRAFSHGCIRLADPFDFAYALLARQTGDPRGTFQSYLATGRETTVNLEQNVPVHLVYRTAFTDARGNLHFRPDLYGRDGRIFDALVRAGVAIPSLGS